MLTRSIIAPILFAGSWLAGLSSQAMAQYPGWPHDGSLYILTTPDGSNLPATASVEGFPLLVRLSKDLYDFSQTQPNGADIRFSAGGKPLAYQNRGMGRGFGDGQHLGAHPGHQRQRASGAQTVGRAMVLADEALNNEVAEALRSFTVKDSFSVPNQEDLSGRVVDPDAEQSVR